MPYGANTRLSRKSFVIKGRKFGTVTYFLGKFKIQNSGQSPIS